MKRFVRPSSFVNVFVAAALAVGVASGQTRIDTLKNIRVPAFNGVDQYVRDNQALIALGKAFFWDMQAGSDGRTACASCHFHAGGDHRLQNQLAGADATLNKILSLDDFPFRKLSDVTNNRSEVLSDRRMAAGSAGVVARAFMATMPGGSEEEGAEPAHGAKFHIGGVRTRQVTERNTPSVINSVFNVRNFWDGRARQTFTGMTPFGESDTGANVWAYRDGQLVSEHVKVENSSLASQGNGPALNEVEMSYAGRDWLQLGRKLLNLPPLGRQKVASDDSVLGAMANPDGNGLVGEISYRSLIEAAFKEEYWSAPQGDAEHTQMERNFPLYWGLALQAYQATLVSDDSRFDRFMEGDRAALTAQEQRGMNVFNSGNAECSDCHGGPEFTAASYTNVFRGGTTNINPQRLGFFRLGVSPLAEDAGMAANDGFNQPLFTGPNSNQTRGAFKAPSLRNVELTGPYFHNGGQATLDQVIEFYVRSGDFPGDGNIPGQLGRIRLGQADRDALVAFLKALTDDRVKYQRAPFDHPSLCIPVGHVESAPGVLETMDVAGGLIARDKWSLIPASGKGGLGVPLQTFDELLRGIGNDGSRAHSLIEPCEP